jgi:hypothetical protein
MTVASVAGKDDFRPESQGIFRLFRNQPAADPAPSAQAGIQETSPDTAIPLPRSRPTAARRADDKVAMAAPGL